MSATIPCVPCCTSPTVTQIPGPEGVGINGSDGRDAFSTLLSPLTVPGVGATVTAAIASTAWMTMGQYLVLGDDASNLGPGTFQVVDILSATSADIRFLGYPGDVPPTTVFPTGTVASPSGRWGLPDPTEVYAAGTAYSLTATPALLDFGTTDPSLVLSVAGTYVLFARVRIDYNGATFAAVRTVTLKIRRTNNTALDIPFTATSFKTDIITTLTYTAQIVSLPMRTYVTANTTDALEIWGSIDVVPSAGSIDAVEAELIALRIA